MISNLFCSLHLSHFWPLSHSLISPIFFPTFTMLFWAGIGPCTSKTFIYFSFIFNEAIFYPGLRKLSHIYPCRSKKTRPLTQQFLSMTHSNFLTFIILSSNLGLSSKAVCSKTCPIFWWWVKLAAEKWSLERLEEAERLLKGFLSSSAAAMRPLKQHRKLLIRDYSQKARALQNSPMHIGMLDGLWLGDIL